MNLILKAAKFAAEKHINQRRKYTGDPYIYHPARVAARVAIHEIATENLVAASFMHDLIEDCNVTYEKIKYLFNEEIANTVNWLTNISKDIIISRAARKLIDRDRLSVAPIPIKIIKMIDRIDNLNELPDCDFASIYREESTLLFDALRDADEFLYMEGIKTCAL